jgi:hypothetical protein
VGEEAWRVPLALSKPPPTVRHARRIVKHALDLVFFEEDFGSPESGISSASVKTSES